MHRLSIFDAIDLGREFMLVLEGFDQLGNRSVAHANFLHVHDKIYVRSCFGRRYIYI